MIKSKSEKFALAAMVLLATVVAFVAHASTAQAQGGMRNRALEKSIRKELVTLPYYGVFDNLAFKIDGGSVTLYGQVVEPVTKSDAEKRVRSLRGVTNVVNNIEVLPLSPADDSIRVRVYRRIVGTAGLYRYMQGTNPSIHIVVNNGHVNLEGVVNNNGDKTLAYMAANQVPGVFSVTNNLVSEKELPR